MLMILDLQLDRFMRNTISIAVAVVKSSTQAQEIDIEPAYLSTLNGEKPVAVKEDIDLGCLKQAYAKKYCSYRAG